MGKSKSGFTIVELLIVIVVIGILAAIVIVSYNGVQGRANDVAVKSDIRSLAMEIKKYEAINGDLPNSGGSSGAIPGGITLGISKKAYSESTSNLYYCVVPNGSDARFSIAARSKSGNIISYYDGGFKDYGGTAFSASTNICPNTGIPTTETGFEYHYGFNGGTSTWTPWTNG